MAFKKGKILTAALLSAALAVTASVTVVSGEYSAAAAKKTEVYYAENVGFVELGSFKDMVMDSPVTTFGLSDRFSGTTFKEQLDEGSQDIYDLLLKGFKSGFTVSGTQTISGGTYNVSQSVDITADALTEIKVENVTGTVGSDGKVSFDQSVFDELSEQIASYATPAYLALSSDHPEMSWLYAQSFGFPYYYTPTKNANQTYTLTVTEVDFKLYSKNVYGTSAQMTSAISTAKSAAGAQDTTYDQVKAIHDYLCTTITYNDTAVKSTLPSGYDDGWYQTAYSAFYRIPQDASTDLGKSTDKNLTVCAGYARSFKALCDQYGIPCIYVVGNGINNSGKPEAHAWNYVKMNDGNWYAVDVTWDDQGDTAASIYTNYFLAGKNTPGFDGKTPFIQSHEATGIMTSTGKYPFPYPELADEAFDPTKVVEETTTEETEPEVTTPKETEPEATTPKETEPEVTTPKETEPEVTTPKETDPEVTTPKETEPEVTTPEETDPEVTTPEETDPDVTAPEETKPEETTPETGAAEPEVTTTTETVVIPAPSEPEPAATTTQEPAPAETTAYSPEQISNINIAANEGENAPKVEVSMEKDELIDAVLSDEEKELLKSGGIDIEIKVENIEDSVSEEDKKAVESALESAGANTIGLYLDINLTKTVGSETLKVTDTNKGITITITLPEELVQPGREFAVVRVHNGETEILKDLDNDPNTVTFETDKFSTYAVVYSGKTDAAVPDNSSNNEDKNQNTAVFFNDTVILAMLLSAVTVLASLMAVYTKYNKGKK